MLPMRTSRRGFDNTDAQFAAIQRRLDNSDELLEYVRRLLLTPTGSRESPEFPFVPMPM